MDGECSVRVTRRYAALPSEVWEALTDPESVSRWLGRPLGTVLRADPPHLLELDWHTDEEPRSIVRLALAEEDGGTLLVLEHLGIAAPRGMVSMSFWTRASDRLPLEAR